MQVDEKEEKIAISDAPRIVSIKVYEDALGIIKDRQYVTFKATRKEPNQPEVLSEALRIADSVGWQHGGQPKLKNVPPQFQKLINGLIRFLQEDPSTLTPERAAMQILLRQMFENYK